MRRRRFIHAVAGTAAAGALAGCTDDAPADSADGDDGGGTTDTTEPTDTSSPTGTDTPTDTKTDHTDTRSETEIGDDTTVSPTVGDRETRTGTMDGVDYAVDVTASECASSEHGTVEDIEFDTEAGKVVVTGTIRAATPCKAVDVAAIEYDEDAGTLAVTVETTDREDGPEMCVQCIGAISYEARFRFGDGVPDEATVSHDGADGEREVASAAHGSASASAPTTDR